MEPVQQGLSGWRTNLGGQMEEAVISEENKLFQSFLEEQDKGSKTLEKTLQKHLEVQEVEKEIEEHLQRGPGEVEDEIN